MDSPDDNPFTGKKTLLSSLYHWHYFTHPGATENEGALRGVHEGSMENVFISLISHHVVFP